MFIRHIFLFAECDTMRDSGESGCRSWRSNTYGACGAERKAISCAVMTAIFMW